MRILLAEDFALLRAGLVQLIQALGHEVTEAVDATELYDYARADKPDLIITDVRMPPENLDDGLKVAYRLRKESSTPVLVLSQYVAASYLDVLLEHGGFGYLLKERIADADELERAVAEVARGGTVVDPDVVATLLRSRKNGIATLTDREREVLALMAEGLSNDEIEKRLVLSASAVRKHVANVFMKLGFLPEDSNRRVKAVLTWLRHERLSS